MSSIRKKYRKMRVKFDEIMRLSNEICINEQHAAATARRLAQENESAVSRPLVIGDIANTLM